MKAYTFCLLALAVFSSARPNPSESGGGRQSTNYPSKWQNQGYNKKAGHRSHGGGGGSPTTTAFPTLSSVIGGYAATGTSGTFQSGVPTGNTTSGATRSKGKITLPAGCQSVNGIGFGWLPDYNGASLAADEKAVGNENPCFAGYYGQTGGSGWNGGAQITDNIADATSGGKPYPIFIASVMPQGTPFGQFTEGSTVVTSIADAMRKLTTAGLTVFLRFGHEMNYYDSQDAGYVYTGSAEEFTTAWGVVAAAVKDIAGVYMYWSPNYDASATDLVSSGWFPSQDTVDIVGMDIYPAGGTTFAAMYQNFCQNWKDIPFIIGETGSKNGGTKDDKHAWLEQLTGTAALQACPNYLGFSWFEYLKGGVDFRIATGGNTAYQGVL